jgi:hypothetical protein
MAYNPLLPAGQATMANSSPVAIASDQSVIPVSGTFWQATQPVSIASSVAVTGPLTDTQLRASAVPVSLASLPSLAAGSNAIGSITNTAFGISGTLPAFASIPTFTIDQTTPGTTNKVYIGTDGAVTISGSISNTSFEATQSTPANLKSHSHGTAFLLAPSYTDGDVAPLTLNLNGGLIVDGSSVTQPVSGSVSLSSPVTIAPASTNGLSVGSGSIGATATTISTNPGLVYGWYIYNTNVTAVYVQFFNALVGSVTPGSTTPIYSIGIPASSGANVFGIGVAHSTAITIAITTGRANGVSPSSTVDYNIFYKS